MPSGPFTFMTDLMHGTREGCIRVVAIPHITIYRIPHDFAQNLIGETELKQAGIYLLVNTETRSFYVGQADSRDNGNGLLGRMLEKHSNTAIDDWTVGFALTSGTPHFFGATELNWLERFFYDEAVKVGKYTVLNGNRPHASDVSYSTRTILSNYVDYAFFLLPYLVGCDVFEKDEDVTRKPVQKDAAQPMKAEEIGESTPQVADPVPQVYNPITALIGKPLMLDRPAVDAHAEGELIDEKQIRVKAGSRISTVNHLMNQAKQGASDLRSKLEESGVIVDRVFTKDYVFSSISMAATVILGTSSSGYEKWQTAGGQTLGERLKELEEAAAAGIPISDVADIPSWSKKHRLTARGADAIGYPLEDNEYLVMAGSRVSADVTGSLKNRGNMYKRRLQMEEKGIIKDGVLTVDIAFSSPSTAASIIAGTSLSGANWKEAK